MAEKESKFNFDIVKVFSSKKIDDKNRHDLQIIKWSTGIPVLENRHFYMTKDGEWHFRKLKGIGVEELSIIVENLEEIKSLLSEQFKE